MHTHTLCIGVYYIYKYIYIYNRIWCSTLWRVGVCVCPFFGVIIVIIVIAILYTLIFNALQFRGRLQLQLQDFVRRLRFLRNSWKIFKIFSRYHSVNYVLFFGDFHRKSAILQKCSVYIYGGGERINGITDKTELQINGITDDWVIG